MMSTILEVVGFKHIIQRFLVQYKVSQLCCILNQLVGVKKRTENERGSKKKWVG